MVTDKVSPKDGSATQGDSSKGTSIDDASQNIYDDVWDTMLEKRMTLSWFSRPEDPLLDQAKYLNDNFEALDRDGNGYIGFFELGAVNHESGYWPSVNHHVQYLQDNIFDISRQSIDQLGLEFMGISRQDAERWLSRSQGQVSDWEEGRSIQRLLQARPDLFGDSADSLDVTIDDVNTALKNPSLTDEERELLTGLQRRFESFASPRTAIDFPLLGTVILPFGNLTITATDLERNPSDTAEPILRTNHERIPDREVYESNLQYERENCLDYLRERVPNGSLAGAQRSCEARLQERYGPISQY